MSRRRSFLFGGEIVPATFIKPEDLPALNDVYALFETRKGNQYLCSYRLLNSDYFTDYKFIAPVCAGRRGTGGFAVFLVPDASKVFSARYKINATGLVVTPGVYAPTTVSGALSDFLGKANMKQTLFYYTEVVGRPESEFEAMVMAREVILNGQACYPASMGELMILGSNITNINYILSLAGLQTYATSLAVASSTIMSSASYLVRRNTLAGSPVSGSKTTAYNIIPITELDVKFTNPNIKDNAMTITSDGGSGSSTVWELDDEGWYHMPEGLAYGATAVIRFTLGAPQYSRFRVSWVIDSLDNNEKIYFSRINTAFSTTSYYLGVGGTVTGVEESYDYVNTVKGTNYVEIGFRRMTSGVSNTNFKIKIEPIV